VLANLPAPEVWEQQFACEFITDRGSRLPPGESPGSVVLRIQTHSRVLVNSAATSGATTASARVSAGQPASKKCRKFVKTPVCALLSVYSLLSHVCDLQRETIPLHDITHSDPHDNRRACF
jgi:hypothetical protein